MSKRNLRAIFIDSEIRIVSEIVMENFTYGDIAKKLRIGLRPYTIACVLHNEDSLFVDDEGLLHNPKHFFVFKDFPQPIPGNGLILGTNECGEAVDALSGLDEVKCSTSFLAADELPLWFKRKNGRINSDPKTKTECENGMKVFHLSAPYFEF